MVLFEVFEITFSLPARGYQDHGAARPFVRPTNPAASHGAHASGMFHVIL